MASATYRSNSSANTTMTLDITESSRDKTKRTFTVKWSVKLGSNTSLLSGHNRTLYIYDSKSNILGQSDIKVNKSWENGGSYSGSFTITCDVGTTGSGTIAMHGMTSTTSVASCTWTNRNYCTDINVSFSASNLPITLNGQVVTAVTFNGQAVDHLIFNGTQLF